MSPFRIAVLVVLAGLAPSGPASALPGRDALNAAKDAATGALGKLNAEITVHTRTFVADYSVNDRYVIEAARIAQRRSNSAQVRAFAETLAADARISESELQQVLHSYNVDAAPASGLDFRRRGMISELNTTPAFTRGAISYSRCWPRPSSVSCCGAIAAAARSRQSSSSPNADCGGSTSFCPRCGACSTVPDGPARAGSAKSP
jgi:predicted outer membrane protein